MAIGYKKLLRYKGFQQRSTLEPALAKERILWIDIARGICMFLVVCMHFDELFFNKIVSFMPAKVMWEFLTSAARPARIPTFFLLSGILASSALSLPLQNVIKKRFLIQYHAFIIWSFIHIIIVFILANNFSGKDFINLIFTFLKNIFIPETQIWFLYALAVFFIISWVTRNYKTSILVISIFCSIFSEFFSNFVLSLMIRSLPFFLIGCHFPELIKIFVEKSKSINIIMLIILYSFAAGSIFVLGFDVPGVWIPATIIGACLILCFSKVFEKTIIGLGFSYIGRKTLPIYVMHGIPLFIASNMLEGFKIPVDSVLINIGQIVFPAVAIIVLIGFCIFLYLALQAVGATWLFQVPGWLSRLVGGNGRSKQ